MVSEVSAIDVARTIFRPVSTGAKAAPCASKLIGPNRGRSTQSDGTRPDTAFSAHRIPPSQGRNTKTPPPISRVSASARTTRSANVSSRRVFCGKGRANHRVSTGKLRPEAPRHIQTQGKPKIGIQ